MAKKFLKNKFVGKLIAYIIRLYVFLLFKTCKFHVNFDQHAMQHIVQHKPCLITFWHGRILVFPKFITSYGKFAALISSHGDADYIGNVLTSYGHRIVRGSSRKMRVAAALGLVKLVKEGEVVGITPDGPRGPALKVKGLVTDVCKKYNIPSLPMCYSATRAITLKTWDSFMLPLPFISKIYIDVETPVYFNQTHNNNYLEKIMLKQMKKLDKITDIAN